MALTKQQKTLLGLGAVAVAAYLIWKQSQDKQNFTSKERDRLALETNEFLSQTAKERQEQARRQAQELLEFKQQLGQYFTPVAQLKQVKACGKGVLGCTAGGSRICVGIDKQEGVHNWSENGDCPPNSTILSNALCGGACK
jgi:gas vesicle GvpC-like protein